MIKHIILAAGLFSVLAHAGTRAEMPQDCANRCTGAEFLALGPADRQSFVDEQIAMAKALRYKQELACIEQHDGAALVTMLRDFITDNPAQLQARAWKVFSSATRSCGTNPPEKNPVVMLKPKDRRSLLDPSILPSDPGASCAEMADFAVLAVNSFKRGRIKGRLEGIEKVTAFFKLFSDSGCDTRAAGYTFTETDGSKKIRFLNQDSLP